MNKILLFMLLVLVTVLGACSKDDENNTAPIDEEDWVVTMVTAEQTPWVGIPDCENGTTITIDWGDGTVKEYTSEEDEGGYMILANYAYGTTKQHTIRIKGTILKLNLTENWLTSLDVSKCKTLRKLSCYKNSLDAEAINKIFTDLPQGQTWEEDGRSCKSSISIGTNPGEKTCNKSIAENKGWGVSNS